MCSASRSQGTSYITQTVSDQGELAADAEGPPATATKTPFPYMTEFHREELGIVLAVQLIPSAELAAVDPLADTAAKTPFP